MKVSELISNLKTFSPEDTVIFEIQGLPSAEGMNVSPRRYDNYCVIIIQHRVA